MNVMVKKFLKRMKVPVGTHDRSLKSKTLGNHMTLQSDISEDNCSHDQGQYECLYNWLYFNNALWGSCVKYVKCITVVSHVHLVGIKSRCYKRKV